ncbi:hypothetical protein BMS3Abin17_01224 [archaeon BMS3Abin17]|nr:hypothetical protein BMS3Abin17_01224 [archaeon BMS3Abin17]HDZ60684.1 hypothetical protein [Candidatus Pacearchaeota archaeon]
MEDYTQKQCEEIAEMLEIYSIIDQSLKSLRRGGLTFKNRSSSARRLLSNLGKYRARVPECVMDILHSEGGVNTLEAECNRIIEETDTIEFVEQFTKIINFSTSNLNKLSIFCFINNINPYLNLVSSFL